MDSLNELALFVDSLGKAILGAIAIFSLLLILSAKKE
jgi:hypothetical protein